MRAGSRRGRGRRAGWDGGGRTVGANRPAGGTAGAGSLVRAALAGLVGLVGLVGLGKGPATPLDAATAARAGGSTGSAADTSRATFAGGCFWCMEPPFDELDGVLATISGYAGGDVANPTYEQVSSGDTGHREVVQVLYDPAEVSYETLLRVFWRNVDPTDDGGQFCDRGFQYTTAIFAHGEEQERAAKGSKDALAASGRLEEPIVTPILPAGPFYRAEEYHQDYYRKKAIRYKFYRFTCGRDRVLERLWGDEAGG